MKAKDIRNMDAKKLAATESDLRKELLKLQMQVAGGTPPENPGKIRTIKRTLARINTIKKEGGNK